MFGSLIPGGGPGAQGMALLKKISSMGGQRPGGGFYQDASVSGPFVPGYGATDPKGLHSPGGGPNAIDNGFIAKLMSGNPGGLIGALMKRQNAPVNPGPPPPAGSDAYVPGGVGPAMGGPAPQVGLLAKMFPQMAMGGGMGQFGGGSGAPRFNPGDLAGW